MERKARSLPNWSARPLRSHLHRLGLIAALVLTTLLVAGPAQACVRPSIIDMWVIIRGNEIWIIIRGFQTFPPPVGVANCVCGVQRVSAIADLTSGHVLDAETGEPIAGFDNFTNNANTESSLTDKAGGSWFGLSSRVIGPIPPPRPSFIQLHGTIRPGVTLQQVIQQLRTTRVATAEADEDGVIPPSKTPYIEVPEVVDPAPGAPAIRLTHMEAGPPQSLELMVRDTEDGLQRLELMASENAAAEIDRFTPGTRAPVRMTIVKIEDESPASFTVRACNVFSECSTQTSSLVGMEVENQRSATHHIFRKVSGDQHKLVFLNGDPGVRMLTVMVNGRRLSLRPLLSGQTLEMDISLALRPENNTVQVSMRGAPGSWGMLLLSDR